MHIFNKAFRVLKKKAHGSLMGQEIVKALRTKFQILRKLIPPTFKHKKGIKVGPESLLLAKHVSRGLYSGHQWVLCLHSTLYSVIYFLKAMSGAKLSGKRLSLMPLGIIRTIANKVTLF